MGDCDRTGRTWVKDGSRQFYMTKMPWTLGHPFATRLTLEIAVNRAHTGVHQSAHLRLVGSFVHDLRMLDLCDGVGFLERGKTGTNYNWFEINIQSRIILTISSGERIPN